MLPHPTNNPLPLVAGTLAEKTRTPAFAAQGGRAANQTVLPHPTNNPLPLVAGTLAEKTRTPAFAAQGGRAANQTMPIRRRSRRCEWTLYAVWAILARRRSGDGCGDANGVMCGGIRKHLRNHLRNNRQYPPAVQVVGRFLPVALKHR